jgi:hypothetical protein
MIVGLDGRGGRGGARIVAWTIDAQRARSAVSSTRSTRRSLWSVVGVTTVAEGSAVER